MEASRVGIADFIQQPLSGPLRHTHCDHRYSIEYGVLWQQVAGGARHHSGCVPSRETLPEGTGYHPAERPIAFDGRVDRR